MLCQQPPHLNPVSYTHLDVYKRQDRNFAKVDGGTGDRYGKEFDLGVYYKFTKQISGSVEYANFKEDDKYLSLIHISCVAACPSGSIYKREEDGIVLVDQDKCRGWRMCVSSCPYKKVFYNWESGKAEKCVGCYPRVESGMPTVCSESCVGRIRYNGIMLYDADRIEELASMEDTQDLYEAQRRIFLDPNDPEVIKAARAEGINEDWLDAARKSPIWKMAMDWKIAFPMHPEFRTLPMVWYVPPLSLIHI